MGCGCAGSKRAVDARPGGAALSADQQRRGGLTEGGYWTGPKTRNAPPAKPKTTK